LFKKIMGYKNLIFDLGGVLMNIDFDKLTHAFQKLGFPNFDKMYSQFTVDNFFEKFETGEVSEEQFYTVLQKIANKGVSKNDITNALNSMFLDFRMESFQCIQQIDGRYKLFLLSNTNPIHMRTFNKI